MSATGASADAVGPHEATNRFMLRFAVAVTAVFLLCEYAGWAPTFLPPILTALLLAKIPIRLPLKMGIVVFLSMVAAAGYAYGVSALLRGKPMVLIGVIALSLFLTFHSMLRGRAVFPLTLLVICLSTIPVVVMVAPGQAEALPEQLIRGMALAVLANWAVHAIWPRPAAPAAAAAAPAPPPAQPSPDTMLALALLSTAAVVPLMLAYLLFGLVDVLAMQANAVMLVITFDPLIGRRQARQMIFANVAGGIMGMLLHTAVLSTPTLPFLGALLFLSLLWFGRRIAGGGTVSAVAQITCNAMMAVLGTALASDPGSLSIWVKRLTQIVLAGAFAAGVMNLIWHRARPPRTDSPSSVAV